MLRNALRKTAYAVAPRAALDAYLRLKMRRDARRLVGRRNSSEDARVWIDDLMNSYFFRPLQQRSELLRLWETVRDARPSNVCEIGAAGGGTAFVFAHAAAPDATIISVDLQFADARRAAVSRFRRRGQRLVCVEGDSHDGRTRDAVRACLQGRALDLLYLDGDHSYDGVVSDFQMYAPLVRAGGLVVFHDIVPDYRTRYGVQTKSDTGGVPRFWDELKRAHASVAEIVEDEAQDGFGIGILHLDGRILEKA